MENSLFLGPSSQGPLSSGIPPRWNNVALPLGMSLRAAIAMRDLIALELSQTAKPGELLDELHRRWDNMAEYDKKVRAYMCSTLTTYLIRCYRGGNPSPTGAQLYIARVPHLFNRTHC